MQVFHLSVPAYPPGNVWFFNPLAWQFLFVLGAVLGSRSAGSAAVAAFHRLVYPLAVAVFAAAAIVKFSWTLNGLWDGVPALFLKELWPVNKNNLSPLRLVPFLALVVLVATHVRPNARFLASRAARPLVLCGQQSLEIFCLSILLSALGHFILAEYNSAIAMQLAVNVLGIATMLLIARMIDWYKRMDRMPLMQPAVARPRGDGTGE